MNHTEETISISPATGEILGRVPVHTPQDLHQCLARARAAQPGWNTLPVKQRARVILRVRDYLVEHAEELAATISRENGKTRTDALATEVMPAAFAVTYYARHAKRFLRPQRLRSSSLLLSNKVSWTRRVPWGVVGIISPWNYPFGIPFSEVIMALLAGNAVILKVASQTPLIGQALAACLHAAGLPEGVFSLLNMPGPVIGKAMLEAGIDKLFFTGSVTAGKQLMAHAAETLTPLGLELGGNDPMLVCPDADLHRAANGAVWAGLSNCGQSCAGVERIYVHSQVYDDFLALLAARVEALRIGVDTASDVDLGAMTTERQVATVRAHLDDALAKGAKIYAQSKSPLPSSDRFLPAMVLTDVNHTMRVMREETFGPVLAVMKVDDMDQAVTLANDSNLGLTASVWSRHTRAALPLASRLQVGTVMINDHLMSHGLPETPWGGFKQSGLGRTHGEIGFAEMTQPQCLVYDRLAWLKKNLWWYPNGPEVYAALRGMLDFQYARSLSRRLHGLGDLLRAFGRVFRS
jgi:succinate-semialdehyde dehydrogenase/glutarate-semialdehyde dehydrogenase